LSRLEALSHQSTQVNLVPPSQPRKAYMKLKDAIAEIKRCRLVDPARATMLEAQVLGRGASVNLDPTDNPEQKAARAMFGLA
jgi:hypothetical protein